MEKFIHLSSTGTKVVEASEAVWDTKVFGFNVAQINHFDLSSYTATGHSIIDVFESLSKWRDRNNVDVISCRILEDQIEDIFALERNGFNFIEMVLHPTLPSTQAVAIEAKNLLEIREIDERKIDDVMDAAKVCFSFERYHVDPRISTTLADQRYANWIKSSYENNRHEILGAFSKDKLLAFFVTETVDDSVYWHLTAAMPSEKGNQTGYKAWLSMIAEHKNNGINKISTTISARNVPVLNLYSKLNFRFTKPHVTLHWVRTRS